MTSELNLTDEGELQEPEEKPRLTINDDVPQTIHHGHKLDMRDRDPTAMNDHVKVFFQDVFAEPDGSHSIDGVWRTSFSTFVATKYWCYRILTAVCGVPTAIMCGIYFACLSFDYIMVHHAVLTGLYHRATMSWKPLQPVCSHFL
ncbi:hypothetical protein ACROYT_G018287 [Oculina patagonica]